MRILIVDKQPVVRRGIRQILGDAFPGSGFGEAEDQPAALEQVETTKWDLVVLDVHMSGHSGLDLLRRIKSMRPGLPVLVLSVEPEEQLGIRALHSGAAGFLNKEVAPATLVAAIRQIMREGRYASSALAYKVANAASSGPQLPHELLSDREYEVLCLIAAAKSPTEIAHELVLSVRTVSTYRTRILEKMNMETSAELMFYAIRHGLIAPTGN